MRLVAIRSYAVSFFLELILEIFLLHGRYVSLTLPILYLPLLVEGKGLSISENTAHSIEGKLTCLVSIEHS